MQASKEDAQAESTFPEEEERLPFTPKHKPKSTRYTEADEGLKEEKSPVEAFDVKVAAELPRRPLREHGPDSPKWLRSHRGLSFHD